MFVPSLHQVQTGSHSAEVHFCNLSAIDRLAPHLLTREVPEGQTVKANIRTDKDHFTGGGVREHVQFHALGRLQNRCRPTVTKMETELIKGVDLQGIPLVVHAKIVDGIDVSCGDGLLPHESMVLRHLCPTCRSWIFSNLSKDIHDIVR